MELTNLDFQQARVKQVLFKSRLRSVVYGVRTADADLLARATNPLGQWLDQVIRPKYGTHHEVAAIERLLGQMLDTGRILVAEYERNHLEEARVGLTRVNTQAEQIEVLLLQLEDKVRG